MSTYSNDITTGGTTTRSDDPEVIRRDIESTRADLSRNVDALTEKVSPSRVVGRRVDRAKDAVGSVKDTVMGASDTATSAPTIARQKTRGNPLAAGMIAFGVGWLASSLIPATEKEQEAASAVKDKASEHSDTLTEPIKEAAGNAKENLRAPAQDAVQSVKATATEATATVKDEAAAAKDDVTGNGSTRLLTTTPQPGRPASCATAGLRPVR
jgi:uncharacterized protein YjbJ (UPF0337 family)